MTNQKISFSQTDWQERVRDYSAWWQGEHERPLILCYGQKQSSVPGRKPHAFLTEYSRETPASQIVSIIEEDLAAKIFYGDAYPCFCPNFGPGVAAAFTGLANLRSTPDTVWFEPAEDKPLSEKGSQSGEKDSQREGNVL